MIQEGPATRADVQKWWSDALDGRCSWDEASAWAEHRLADGSDTEVVLEGLLQLHSARLRGLPSNELKDVMSANLVAWHRRLVSYDADPTEFERAHLRRVLASFAQSHGAEAAQRFGRKMMARGPLTESDLHEAIRPVQAVDLET